MGWAFIINKKSLCSYLGAGWQTEKSTYRRRSGSLEYLRVYKHHLHETVGMLSPDLGGRGFWGQSGELCQWLSHILRTTNHCRMMDQFFCEGWCHNTHTFKWIQKLLFPALISAGWVSSPRPGATGNDYLCPTVPVISLREKWVIRCQLFSCFRGMRGKDDFPGCFKENDAHANRLSGEARECPCQFRNGFDGSASPAQMP